MARTKGSNDSGKLFRIHGKTIRLYTRSVLIKKLAMAGIPRNSLTLRNWERDSILPPPMIRYNGIVYYSMAEIDTIVRVGLECGIRKGYPIENTKFKERVAIALQKVREKFFIESEE